MRFERANENSKRTAEKDSGPGKPLKSERVGLLRAAILGATMGSSIMAGVGKRPEPRPAPEISEQDRNSLNNMVEEISNAPKQSFGKEYFTSDELQCLTRNVYHEARGESVRGKYAVMFATLERALDKNYPNSICGVVHQRHQFSWTSDDSILSEPINMHEYLAIAIEVHTLVQNRDLSGAALEAGLRAGLPRGAVFYKVRNFTGSKRVEKFFSKLKRVAVIGSHEFYIAKEAPKTPPHATKQNVIAQDRKENRS